MAAMMSTFLTAWPAPPYDAGNRSQVFVDRALVRSADNVAFRLIPGEKRRQHVWFSHDDPNSGPAGVFVIRDREEGIFKSWSSRRYKTSKDGIHWGPKQRSDASWNHLLRESVIKDMNDLPERRYKVVAFAPSSVYPRQMKDADVLRVNPDGTRHLFWYEKGYNTYVSPDGRKLTHFSRKPICIGPSHPKPPGDMVRAYYDRRLKAYVAFVKTGPMDKRLRTKFTAGRRTFAVLTSKDFVTWTQPELVFVPDQIDDDDAMARIEKVRPLLPNLTDPGQVKTDVYGVGGPIQLESCVLVTLRLYTRHNRIDGGFSEIQMAVSRDLKRWERPFRKPFIPRGRIADGPESSDWDTCWFNNEGPGVEVGDEVWVYYTARNTPHNHPVGFSRSRFSREAITEARRHVGTKYKSGIGIAAWKRDRFVAVTAPATGGSLTTPPMTFSGNRLELNARTRRGGQVVVTLLDASGKPLSQSRPFVGDDLRHRVQWTTPLDLKALQGMPIALRFQMKDAEVFAFAFREQAGEKGPDLH